MYEICFFGHREVLNHILPYIPGFMLMLFSLCYSLALKLSLLICYLTILSHWSGEILYDINYGRVASCGLFQVKSMLPSYHRVLNTEKNIKQEGNLFDIHLRRKRQHIFAPNRRVCLTLAMPCSFSLEVVSVSTSYLKRLQRDPVEPPCQIYRVKVLVLT